MTVILTVHRATNQIGGNCIEIITAEGRRLILDVGRPLDAPKEATGLLPKTLDLASPADGILISHPHQDHYGLLDETPKTWPVYCGLATEKLIRLTSGIFGPPIERDFRSWKSGQAFAVGPFTVTPFLTDHSAFDSYMLLIEVENKRILYSGDFRLSIMTRSSFPTFLSSVPYTAVPSTLSLAIKETVSFDSRIVAVVIGLPFIASGSAHLRRNQTPHG